jgi:hypothetical protein
MSVTLETRLVRNDDILYAPVGAEEAVMMSIEAGRYFGLNAVGARIWELLETPRTIAELCERIAEEFEVDVDSCGPDVVKFTDSLIDNGIVSEAKA